MLFGTPLGATELAAIEPGKWVRIQTGDEPSGRDATLSEGNARDKSRTKQNRTVYVNGQPVRAAKPGENVQGIFRNLDEENLLLERPGTGGPIVVPREMIVSVDVRQRGSKKGKAAGIGAAVGLGLGVALGLASGNDPSGCWVLCFTAGQKAALFSVLTVPVGALVGVAAAPGAVWDRNVATDRLRVTAAPTRGRGVGLSVSFGF